MQRRGRKDGARGGIDDAEERGGQMVQGGKRVLRGGVG